MKRRIPMLVLLLTFVCTFAGMNTASAQINFGFGGSIALEPQYWSKIGSGDDPKFGVGFSGMAGVGIAIDADMKVIVGPRIAYSMWSADYSDKPQSATQSVYVRMQDAGIGVHAEFDDMWLQFGTGKSEISSGMMVGGQDIEYPYSGDEYTYYNVGLGYKSGIFSLGIGFTSYTDYAQYCDHLSFILGLSI